MFTTYLVVVACIFAIGIFGIVIDRLYRLFAQRHPTLGPFRDNNSGKCGCCAAKAACKKMQEQH